MTIDLVEPQFPSPEDTGRGFRSWLLTRSVLHPDWEAICVWIDNAILRFGALQMQCGHDADGSFWEWALLREDWQDRQEEPGTEP